MTEPPPGLTFGTLALMRAHKAWAKRRGYRDHEGAIMDDYEHDSIELHREANDAYFGNEGLAHDDSPADRPCETFTASAAGVRCLNGAPACETCGYSERRHA